MTAAVDAPLWAFHLPGQHNQQSHGGGGDDDDDGPGLDDDEGPSEYDEGLSGSYLGKYGSVKDHYAADTNHAIIVPERGRMHVADDTRGRENREVLQEVTPKQANAISDDVWEVSQGGSGRDSAAGVRVDPGGGIPAGSADWTGAVDVTWSNGRTSEYSFDDAFELQEGLTIMAGLEASALWQFGDTNPVTAAARRKPRTVDGPSLQELDDAADTMAALVAVHLGRVAGFAARNLGGLTVAASAEPEDAAEPLWAFHLPGKHNQKSHAGAHYSKGRDLMKDDPAGLAEAVAADRLKYPASRDGVLSAIAARQGFDGKPEIVSKAEMDRLHKSGRPHMLRGASRSEDGSKTGGQINEEMRSGDAAFGTGVYGNGYYFAPPGGRGFAGAEGFADGSPGSLARATLRPDANVVKIGKVRGEQDAYFKTLGYEPSLYWETPHSTQDVVFGDLGRFATAKGYDAIQMDNSKAGGNIPPQWLVVNRTALIVEEGP